MGSGVRSCRASFQFGCRAGRSCACSRRKQATKKPADKPIAPDRPFVLAVAGTGGPRIAALNEAAEAAGLALGEPLADARAKAGFLQVRAVDTAADDAALRRLALWATRYTPTASPWDEENGADGFFLDIEGAAHLFGGEESLIADLAARLAKTSACRRGLPSPSTPGAAWALSRFHAARLVRSALGAGSRSAVAACRSKRCGFAPETRTTLRRLGFKTVGALIDKPRAPFAARFPPNFCAVSIRRSAASTSRSCPSSRRRSITACVICSSRSSPRKRSSRAPAGSCRRSSHVLTRDDVGARALRLSLYRVDGAVETIDIGLTLPTRSVAHVARLIELKLEALAAMQDDAGFGFEAIGLAVTRAEPMPARQTEFTPSAGGWRPHRTLRGLDRRAAPASRPAASVRRFAPVASHLPERAEVLSPVTWRNGIGMARLAASGERRDRFCSCRRPSRPRSPRSSPTVRRGVFAGAA